MTDEDHARAIALADAIRHGKELHNGAQVQLLMLADAVWDKRNWVKPKNTIILSSPEVKPVREEA